MKVEKMLRSGAAALAQIAEKPYEGKGLGDVAEWLRSGLQIRTASSEINNLELRISRNVPETGREC